jgi:hypothetical protein
MDSKKSISRWISRLQGGDPRAAEQLWQRYFEQLVRLARNKLKGARRRVADEEDVALSAFASFCAGARAAFPNWTTRTTFGPFSS